MQARMHTARRSSGRSGSGMRRNHFRNTRSMSYGPSASQIFCNFIGSEQERNPLSSDS
jgi:hypothetical protein